MEKNGLFEDIQELNLSYLLLVQRLLSEDRELAMFRLKIDARMADLLAGLTVREVTLLSRSNQLLCRPVFTDAEQLEGVLRSGRNEDLAQTQLALLMATTEPK